MAEVDIIGQWMTETGRTPVTPARQTIRKIAISLAAGLIGAGAVSGTMAAQATWVGGTDTNNWNNAANWSPAAVPTNVSPASDVVFSLTGSYAANLTAAGSAGSVTQTQGDLAVNLGGFGLAITNGFMVNGSTSANPQLTLSGGTATTGEVAIGRGGGSGRMTVTGGSAAINVAGTDSLFVGNARGTTGNGFDGAATGTLNLTSGGDASAFNIYVGHYGGSGTVTVNGAGSTLSTTTGPFGTPSLNVGAVTNTAGDTSGFIVVSNGGALRTNAGNTNATIGGTGTGTITVQDSGSSWTHTGAVFVGTTAAGQTMGTLNIKTGATVNISSSANDGTLRIGAAGLLNLADSGSTLNVDSMDLASNAANVHFTGGTLNLAGAIKNVGSTPLSIGGTLGGGGTIQGGVTVPSTGRIRPGDGTTASTFTINGPLNVAGTMQMRLLGVNSNSKIIVTSAATPTLTGTIALSLDSNYTPAIGASFDLLDFAGTLGPGYTFDFSGASLGSGKQWNTSAFAATGSVSVSATPEPGTAVLAMLAGSPLLVRRRKCA